MKSASHSFRTPKILVWWTAVAVTLLITSCATLDFDPFSQKPPEITGAVVAADTLNSRRDGLSTSVVVRIYQLKAPSEFTQADFFTLYERGNAKLNPDALIKELIVLPGSTTVLDRIELDKESTYVGVLAAFRDWENANWRAVLETPANKTTILNIQLMNSDVSLTKAKRGWLRQTRKEAKNKPEDY